MTPIEVLDEVLSLLANDVELKSPDASAADIGEVFLKKHPELKDARFYSDLFRILAKLKKEGYIDSRLRKREQELEDETYGIIYAEVDVAHYFTTFDGNLFALQGGYQAQSAKEKLELEKIKSLEQNQMAFQQSQIDMMKAQTDASVLQGNLTKKIVRLTIWIAVGTIIAALYYASQLVPWIFQVVAYLKYKH